MTELTSDTVKLLMRYFNDVKISKQNDDKTTEYDLFNGDQFIVVKSQLNDKWNVMFLNWRTDDQSMERVKEILEYYEDYDRNFFLEISD